jgi:hypothetical protein
MDSAVLKTVARGSPGEDRLNCKDKDREKAGRTRDAGNRVPTLGWKTIPWAKPYLEGGKSLNKRPGKIWNLGWKAEKTPLGIHQIAKHFVFEATGHDLCA